MNCKILCEENESFIIQLQWSLSRIKVLLLLNVCRESDLFVGPQTRILLFCTSGSSVPRLYASITLYSHTSSGGVRTLACFITLYSHTSSGGLRTLRCFHHPLLTHKQWWASNPCMLPSPFTHTQAVVGFKPLGASSPFTHTQAVVGFKPLHASITLYSHTSSGGLRTLACFHHPLLTHKQSWASNP